MEENIGGLQKKEGGLMSEKQFKVVLSYDVQKTFYVEADNEDEAYDKAYAGAGEVEDEDWEYRDHIETEEV